MVKQVLTAAEVAQVNDDFEVYFPIIQSASLNLQSQAAYLVTDPAIDASAVNVRHLLAYSNFRGDWAASPAEQPYSSTDIVFDDADNRLYRNITGNNGTNTPADDTTNWELIGGVSKISQFAEGDTYYLNDIVVRGGSGSNAGELFRFIGTTARTGQAAPLPDTAAGTTSNTNWTQVGGGGLAITPNGATTDVSGILTLAGGADVDVTQDTTATTQANLSLRAGLSGLPATIPTTTGTDRELVLQQTAAGTLAWVQNTDENDDTTYTIGTTDGTSGAVNINLTDSSSVVDTISLSAGGDLSISQSSDAITMSFSERAGLVWNAATRYVVGDIVAYRTGSNDSYNLYVCHTAGISATAPSTAGSNWQEAVVTNLNDIEDVQIDTSTLATDYYLFYDATHTYMLNGATVTGAWRAKAFPAIPSNIEDLSNVTFTDAADDQVLRRFTTAGGTTSWVNSDETIAPYRSTRTYNTGDLVVFTATDNTGSVPAIITQLYVALNDGITVAPSSDATADTPSWARMGASVSQSANAGEINVTVNGVSTAVDIGIDPVNFDSAGGTTAGTLLNNITFAGNNIIFSNDDGSATHTYTPPANTGTGTGVGVGTTNDVLITNAGGTVSWVKLGNDNIAATAAITGSKLAADTIDSTRINFESTAAETTGHILALGANNEFRTIDPEQLIDTLAFRDEGTNSEFRDLDRFYDDSLEESLSVRSVEITTNGTFRIQVASFISDSAFTVTPVTNRAWDQAASTVAFAIDNPPSADFPTRYINAVSTSTLTRTAGFGNSTITASTVASPSPAPGVDWTQTFNINSAYFLNAAPTSPNGGSWSATVDIVDNNGVVIFDNVPFTVTWQGVAFTPTMVQPPAGRIFLESFPGPFNYNISSVTGLSDMDNFAFTGISTTNTDVTIADNTMSTGSVTVSPAIHKDSGTAGTTYANFIWNTTFTQPASTGSLAGGDHNIVENTQLLNPTFIYPVFSFTTARANSPVLTNAMLVDGMDYDSSLTDYAKHTFDDLQGNSVSYDLTADGAVNRILWIGARDVVANRNRTFTSRNSNLQMTADFQRVVSLTPDAAPSGYVAEQFRFYGFNINAGVDDALDIT